MWSMGCCIYELMQITKPDYDHRQRILFPGDSCNPLSPFYKNRGENKERVTSSRDQMVVICQKLPKLSKNDLTFINKKEAIDYMTQISSKEEDSKIVDEKIKHNNP